MSDETQIPELGALGLVRYFWRQLTSMRTALVLLLLLALHCYSLRGCALMQPPLWGTHTHTHTHTLSISYTAAHGAPRARMRRSPRFE